MTCSSCGFENGPDARFCASCGSELQRLCPSCGHPVDPDAFFCTRCGTRLSEAAAEPAAPPGEERKVITVLFVDVVGFTSRAEQLDPEDVRRLLAPLYRRVHAEVERFDGSVEKFMGDAVMALFGVPVAHEDDPERAVRAAFALREVLAELNDADPGLDLKLRMAVNTGEALVALGADPARGEWTAAGDVVNTCARMQSAAPVDGILVGEATYRATRGSIEYRPAEPVQAKGKREPVPVWEALAASEPVRAPRFERDLELVGRSEELGFLVDTLQRMRRESSSQLVTIVGVPGIGKSRLVLELRAALEAESYACAWLQGRSLPYGDGVTFAALAEMLKAHAGILETDGAGLAAAKLRLAIARLGLEAGEARWVERHLSPLVGLAGEEELGGDRRGEAFAAWRRAFEALAEREPAVLVFEDLHWADEDLLDFVDYVAEWVTDLPLLVLGTTRPELLERRPGWGGGKRNAASLSLGALSDEQTAELVAARLERVSLPAAVQSQLLARAGGNPLYAAEYVRMLADRVFAGYEELPVPETVHGIIAARLDALPAEEKGLLHDGAVLGEFFWVGALAAVSSAPRSEVEERLRVLERKEFVRRERASSVAGEPQYAFRHALVQEVAYGQLARTARAEKHRAAAAWIESLASDRSENQAEMLSHHYLRALEYARATGQSTAGLTDRAGRALTEAGDRAFGLNAYGPAVRFYSAALDLLPPDDPLRAERLFRFGRSRFHAEQEGEEELKAARDALLSEGNRERAAEAEVLLHGLYTTRGQRDEARVRLEEAAALVADAEMSASKAHVLTSTSRFLLLAGDNEGAIRVGREALAMADGLGLDDVRCYALNNVGVARVTSGDLGGTGDIEASIAVAEEIGSPESVRGHRFLAASHVLLGDLETSAGFFAGARRSAERFGDAFNRRWLQAALSLEHYWSGAWDEALAAAGEFIAASEGGSAHYMEAPCRRVRGLIHLARGDVAAAAAEAERSLEFSRMASDPWFFHPSLSFAARALLAQGREAEAGALVDELLELWQSGRATLISLEAPDAALVAAALGRGAALLEATGDVERPTRWLAASRALLGADEGTAAELFAAIGTRPDEASARLRHAESLRAAGQAEPAEAEVAAALVVFRSVGAVAYIAEAEALSAVP